MTTLKELLIQEYGYGTSDFAGAGGELVIDSDRGLIYPLGTDARAVRLDQIFKVGHYVNLSGFNGNHVRFVVVGLNQDGVNAVSASGEQGFLPWELMAAALQNPSQVGIAPLNELGGLDDSGQIFVAEEIARLSREIRRHESAIADLHSQRDKLEGLEAQG